MSKDNQVLIAHLQEENKNLSLAKQALEAHVSLLEQEIKRLTELKNDGVNTKAVRYIGPRAAWNDHLYGSDLTFTKDEIKLVPVNLATKFMHHLDMFEEVDKELADGLKPELGAMNTSEETENAANTQREELETLYEIKQSIKDMKKPALLHYAQEKYGVKFDQAIRKDELVDEVNLLVDRFGAV